MSSIGKRVQANFIRDRFKACNWLAENVRGHCAANGF
jgi:hypothetical protein